METSPKPNPSKAFCGYVPDMNILIIDIFYLTGNNIRALDIFCNYY